MCQSIGPKQGEYEYIRDCWNDDSKTAFRWRASIYEDMPTLSKSRIMTAICARLAASATRVKSLRKVSVEGALTSTGAGGIILLDGDDRTDEAADVCCETGD